MLVLAIRLGRFCSPTNLCSKGFPNATQFAALAKLLERFECPTGPSSRLPSLERKSTSLCTLLQSDLLVPLPLHISMSRALSLKTQDRDEFQKTVESYLRHSNVSPFEVALADLKWVPNYDGNRWFLVLGIVRPAHNELNQLLEACNKACSAYGHPQLYATQRQSAKRRRISHDASVTESDHSDAFHFSIAWNLDGSTLDFEQLKSSDKVISMMEQDIKPIHVHFDSIKLKIGNVVTSIPLGKQPGQSSSILGDG